MQVKQLLNGKYIIEDNMGNAERNQMGDILYYDTLPFHCFLMPVVQENRTPFDNPLSYDPFKKQF